MNGRNIKCTWYYIDKRGTSISIPLFSFVDEIERNGIKEPVLFYVDYKGNVIALGIAELQLVEQASPSNMQLCNLMTAYRHNRTLFFADGICHFCPGTLMQGGDNTKTKIGSWYLKDGLIYITFHTEHVREGIGEVLVHTPMVIIYESYNEYDLPIYEQHTIDWELYYQLKHFSFFISIWEIRKDYPR